MYVTHSAPHYTQYSRHDNHHNSLSAVAYSSSPVESDSVNFSAQARALSAAEDGDSLMELKPISLDPKVHAQNAKDRIETLLREMGVSVNTPVTITSHGSEVKFEVDHPNAEHIAAKLSQDRELSSSIGGARAAAALQRIAQASQQAWESVPEGDVAAAERALAWIQNFAHETHSMPYQMQYGGEQIVASFIDDKGNTVDYMNNFSVPKFA